MREIVNALLLSWLAITCIPSQAAIAGVLGASGDLYVTSHNTDQVIEFDPSTGTAVGAFASGSLHRPRGLLFASDGNLFVAGPDPVSGGTAPRVFEFSGATGGEISGFAIGGSDEANDILFTSDGRLLVSNVPSNEAGSLVMAFSASTGAFLGNFATANLFNPQQMLQVGSSVLVENCGVYDDIRRYDLASGALLGDFVSANSGGLDDPTGMTFGPNGDLFVSSYQTNQILEYNGANGAFVKVFAGGSELNGPRGLKFGPDGGLYVTSYFNSSIVEYDGDSGAYVRSLTGGGLDLPVDLVFKPVPEPRATLGFLMPLLYGLVANRNKRR